MTYVADSDQGSRYLRPFFGQLSISPSKTLKRKQEMKSRLLPEFHVKYEVLSHCSQLILF